MRTNLGQFGPAVRLMILFTIVLGLAYPLAVLGVGQAAFHHRANGSLVTHNGAVVGSSLIGQSFSGAGWFLPRPSAAGNGYDPHATGASNLSLDNPKLIAEVKARQNAIAQQDGVPVSQVPADAVLASGSGLDPDISPAYAELQVHRVAAARRLPVATVANLVTQHTTGRTLGFLGEPRVNVLELNLALARIAGGTS